MMPSFDRTRRQALQLAAAATVCCALPATAAEADVPVTGNEVPELAAFDRWIKTFMAEHGVPGGQLAIARGGKVLCSRGYGYADRQEQSPVQPQSLFRIASISKSITAVAILRLVQQQKLKLDDRVDDVLQIEPHREPDTKLDERWQQINIAHLLAHTGGWNRDKSYDPMFAYERIRKSLDVELPIGTAEIIRYMRGQPLDTNPGETYAYSNFGYCLLGRVIEKLSGVGYADFVQREVFSPLGISAPRIGGSLVSERIENEVRYYCAKDEQVTPVVGPHAGDASHRVPLAYGGWNHEALDAHGGWIASCEDLVRFAAGVDDAPNTQHKSLLSASLVKQMFSSQAKIRSGVSYGFGWLNFSPANESSQSHAHSGALPCTTAALVKWRGDTNLAVLFNLGKSKEDKFLAAGLDTKLASLAAEVTTWPS